MSPACGEIVWIVRENNGQPTRNFLVSSITLLADRPQPGRGQHTWEQLIQSCHVAPFPKEIERCLPTGTPIVRLTRHHLPRRLDCHRPCASACRPTAGSWRMPSAKTVADAAGGLSRPPAGPLGVLEILRKRVIIPPRDGGLRFTALAANFTHFRNEDRSDGFYLANHRFCLAH